MARPKTAFPQLRHYKTRNTGRVRVEGKEIHFGPWGAIETKRAYEAWLSRYLACGRQLRLMDGAMPDLCRRDEPLETIGDLCAAYLKHCEAYYSRDGRATSHIYAVKSALRALIAYLGMQNLDLAPEELTPFRFRGFLDWLSVERRSTLCRQTMNRYAAVIRAMCRWAAERDLVHSDIASRLSLVSGLRKGRSAYSGSPPPREGVGRVAASISAINRARPELEPCVRAMVDIQLFTGMRPGEVCAIRPRDIQPTEDNRVLLYVISRGVDKVNYQRDDANPRDRRYALLGRRAAPLLRAWMRGVEPDEFVFSPKRAAQLRGRQFHRSLIAHYTTNAYSRAIRRACERAGLARGERWTPHQLRHAFATQYTDETTVEKARIQLGHSDLKTTQGYLAPEWRRLIPDAAERF